MQEPTHKRESISSNTNSAQLAPTQGIKILPYRYQNSTLDHKIQHLKQAIIVTTSTSAQTDDPVIFYRDHKLAIDKIGKELAKSKGEHV